ncbi:MAG: EthD family reductase [Actinobacteria bacterium]|nr:EthD family reductase [Actinomycetota bacterium]
MLTVHIWLRKKDEMSTEDFARYWLERHAPIARDGYEHLRDYVVNLVTRVPEGQERLYDGVAALSWDDRDGFSADMKSEAAKRAAEDLKTFTEGAGLLFVEATTVK